MNESQKAAILSEGPTLLIAGPGTGKTYTIIQRVLYLIREKRVKPEEIMLVTYTQKASKELTTRLTDVLSKVGIEVNLHEMYIGTFHHICRKILKEFQEYTHLPKNYLSVDQFEQQYLVYEHLSEFAAIPNFRRVIQDSYLKQGELVGISPWRQCQTICRYVNGLSEELLLTEEMRRTCGNQLGGRIEVLARMMMKYTRLEEERHFIDFSRLQKETYALLSSYPEILDRLQKRIRYIMIDEYRIRISSKSSSSVFWAALRNRSSWWGMMTRAFIASAGRPSEIFWDFRRPIRHAIRSSWIRIIVRIRALSASAWTGCADSKAGAERMGGCSAM